MSSRGSDPTSAHHRQGLLIDSNLLLLLFVGQYDPTRIQKFKRTDQFTVGDYELLADYVEQFRELVTTPSILTEVSNLLGQLPENLRYHFGGSSPMASKTCTSITRPVKNWAIRAPSQSSG